MERIIHCQLSAALESNNLISESQHGFHNKHSTITLLASTVGDWAACLKRRNSVHSLLLDLAKAFDSVPHQQLLLWLESLGIHGNLLSWFDYFLTKRYQRVVVNGSFSEWLPVRCGVPQGSVLGPLLFLLYVDELHRIVQHSNIKLFADDIALCKEIVFPSDHKLLQDDLTAVVYTHENFTIVDNESGTAYYKVLSINNVCKVLAYEVLYVKIASMPSTQET